MGYIRNWHIYSILLAADIFVWEEMVAVDSSVAVMGRVLIFNKSTVQCASVSGGGVLRVLHVDRERRGAC